MDGGKDWLEAILKRKAYDESPIRVLELEEGDPSPGKGENYLSKIKKIRAKVLLGSGKIKTASFLIKSEHDTENMKKLSSEDGFFVREITMYRDVLPKMQALIEEIKDPEGIFWPKCYDVRLYNRLIFEDLGVSGFRMANRLKQLSLNAALMAIRHLAKFHALSKILMVKGEIPMDIFKNMMWVSNPEKVAMTRKMIAMNFQRMSKKMETWGDEWREAAERLKAADISDRFIEALSPLPDEFTVLCHCDTWTNNMMFKGEDLENPTAFKLIDLQVCTVNSPAKDISQLLQTSVRLEDRTNHTDLLIQTYTDTLQSYLLRLGYEGEVPNVDDIKIAIARKGPVCLGDAFGFIPIVLAAPEHAPDFEKAMKDHNDAKERGEEFDFNSDSFNLQKNLTPIAESVIKYEIKLAMKSGLI